MCDNARKKRAKRTIQKTQKTKTYPQKTQSDCVKKVRIGNVEYDSMQDVDFVEAVAENVKCLNKRADDFLKSHHCAKCGKNLVKCKCKGEMKIIEDMVEKESLNYSSEVYGENCGNQSKSCRGNNKKQKNKSDDDMDDLDFDEMNDVWDELDGF
jgi:hypothetical protein